MRRHPSFQQEQDAEIAAKQREPRFTVEWCGEGFESVSDRPHHLDNDAGFYPTRADLNTLHVLCLQMQDLSLPPLERAHCRVWDRHGQLVARVGANAAVLV